MNQQTHAVPDDAEALSQFTCDTTNLPWPIFRAAFRAEQLAELPARARALLAALARTVDADRPYAAIFARRELLTGRALQSMRTFYRSLEDLETAGLIHRPPQKRHAAVGLFGRAYLHLTPRAATLLGFVQAEASSHTEPAAAGTTAAAKQAAPAVAQNLPSASVADGGIYKDLSPTAFQKRQPGQLPPDLQRLRSLGFHEFLIFKLMREARQHGKLLSDIVAVVWDHLKVAQRPIAYLRKLLNKPVDFRHQRIARDTKQEAVQQAQRDSEALHDAIARCAGQTFFDPAATRKAVIHADVPTLQLATEAQPRVFAGAWQAGFVAALRDGQWVPATAELEEQFAVRRRDHQRAVSTASERPMPRTPSVDRSGDFRRLVSQLTARFPRAA